MDAETLFLGSTRDGVVGSLGFGYGYKGLTPMLLELLMTSYELDLPLTRITFDYLKNLMLRQFRI